MFGIVIGLLKTFSGIEVSVVDILVQEFYISHCIIFCFKLTNIMFTSKFTAALTPSLLDATFDILFS